MVQLQVPHCGDIISSIFVLSLPSKVIASAAFKHHLGKISVNYGIIFDNLQRLPCVSYDEAKSLSSFLFCVCIACFLFVVSVGLGG